MSDTSSSILSAPVPESFDSRRIRARCLKDLFGDDAPDLLQIGRYRLIRPLGDGGQGSVYLAHDPSLERNVALKMLHRKPDERSNDLLAEAQTLARVGHVNVVAVHDFGESSQGEPYFVMELVEGNSLDQWLALRRRTWTEVLDVLIQVGRGLSAIHERDIVHRDVKPANVMLTADGKVKLVDLGIAIKPTTKTGIDADRGTDVETATLVAGTLPYLAPEVFDGEPQDQLGDQYSFCVTLFRALHQRFPPRVLSTSAGPPSGTVAPPTPAVSGSIPRSLARVLARGLSREPRARFPSMNELVSALERVRRQRSRRVITGLVVMAISATGFALVLAARSPELPCESRPRASDLWGNEQRDEVRTAFIATRAPRADTEFSNFDRFLTGWVEEYDASHQQACESLLRDDEDYSRSLGRLACLDEARGVLDSLVRGLPEITPSDVVHTSERMRGLPLIAACDQPSRLEACDPGQAIAGFKEEVTAIEIDLQAAESRIVLGRYDEGIALADHALVLAEPEALAPVRARILLVRGRLAYEGQQLELALASLREARSLAEQSGCDGVGAETLTLLAKIGALKRDGSAKEAEDWSQAALDKIVWLRLGGERKADALNSRGLVLHHRSRDYEGADALYREAAEIREGLLPSSTLALSDTLLNRGSVLGRLGRDEEAIAQLQRAYELRAKALGDDHPSLYKVHANLSERFLDADDTELALRHGRRAVELAEGFGPSVKLAQQHTRLARILGRNSELDEAIVEAERALRILEQVLPSDDIHILDAWGTLGQLQLDNDQPALARPWLQKHYEASLIHPDMDGLHRAIVGYRLAELERQSEQPARARERYAQAREMLSAEPRFATHVLHGHIGLGEGRALRALGDEEEAVVALRAALTAWRAADGSNPEREALTRWELAQALCATPGNRAEAQRLATAARDYYGSRVDPSASSHSESIETWLEEITACR